MPSTFRELEIAAWNLGATHDALPHPHPRMLSCAVLAAQSVQRRRVKTPSHYARLESMCSQFQFANSSPVQLRGGEPSVTVHRRCCCYYYYYYLTKIYLLVYL